MGYHADNQAAFVETANTHFASDARWELERIGPGTFYDMWLLAATALTKSVTGEYPTFTEAPAPSFPWAGGFQRLQPELVNTRIGNVSRIQLKNLYFNEIVDMLERDCMRLSVPGVKEMLTAAGENSNNPELTQAGHRGLRMFINGTYGVLSGKGDNRIHTTPPVGIVTYSIKDRMSRLFRLFPESIYCIDTDRIWVTPGMEAKVLETAQVLFDSVTNWEVRKEFSVIFLNHAKKLTVKWPDGTVEAHGLRNPVDTLTKFIAWRPQNTV